MWEKFSHSTKLVMTLCTVFWLHMNVFIGCLLVVLPVLLMYKYTRFLTERRCGVKQICGHGKYPFHIKSGYLRDGPASICFRGK